MPKFLLVLVCLLGASHLHAQCSFSLVPNSASFNSSGGNGLITVTASSAACSRTASSSVPWITISFGTPGTGNGTVGYTVSVNTSPASRTGTLTVAGQTFTVSQSAATCTFNLNPASVIASGSGDTGTVNFGTNCSWTASTATTWISITSATSGMGDGSISWSAAANPTTSTRTGSITIGNATFAISQGPGNCTYTINPGSAAFPNTGGNGSFSLSTGCNWTAATQANWITITSATSGTGDSVISYTVAANTGGTSRTGTITLGGQSFSITQNPLCTLTFSTPNATIPATGGTGSVAVTASGSTCDRSVTTDLSWITITAGQTGTGNGTVSFSVGQNPGSDGRSGTIFIGGQGFYVTQLGGTCTYTLSPISANVPINGASGTFVVTTSCGWTATSNVPWISLAGTTSGTGAGTVTYTVQANGSGEPRFGSVQIGTQAFNIFQAGAVCSVTLTPNSATTGSAGGEGSVNVTAPDGCSWKATPSAPWVAVTSGNTGTGEGTVTWRVAANSDAKLRTGAIAIGNQLFNITQSAFTCAVSLSSTGISVPSVGGANSFGLSAACNWTAASSVPWIQITSPLTGSTDGTITFQVLANNTANARTGLITVSGQTFTVSQAGAGCALTITPVAADVPASGGAGTITVTGGPACSWTPASSDGWLKVTWSNVSGSGTVTYTAAASDQFTPRSATITVAGQTATITQAAAVVKVTSILNAASYATVAVAPGEIVTIYGSTFGPPALARTELTDDHASIKTILSDTRVLFDGVPAPMIYAVAGQVSAVVPYSVSGKQTTNVQVEYKGVQSDVFTVDVAASAPGLFTIDASGKGQGAFLNQNNTVNSATNPVARGQYIILFATGEGATNPDGVDGKLAGVPLPRPLLPVAVQIGNVNATNISYAGAAPGLVSGLLQINVLVPSNAPTGAAVPIFVRIGTATSQAGVTLAVR